jgi:hypothetical protein
MVETEGNEQSEKGGFWYSQEADDIGRWQEENRGSAKTEMGQGQGSDGLLEHRPFPPLVGAAFRSSEGGFSLRNDSFGLMGKCLW